MTAEEVGAFVGDNHLYYYGKWNGRWDRHSPWAGFNFAAAIFGLLWLVHRRMYLEAVLLFVVRTAIGWVTTIACRLLAHPQLAGPAGWVVASALSIALGALGNGIYRRRALAARAIALHASDPDQRRAVLAARGGTRTWPVVLVIAVGFALALVQLS